MKRLTCRRDVASITPQHSKKPYKKMTNGDLLTSSTMLGGLQCGELSNRLKAQQRFYVLYAPLIYRRCERLGCRYEDALDITHEVVVKALERITTFQKRDRPGSFRRWLTTITLNAIRDRLRKRTPTLLGDDVKKLTEPVFCDDPSEQAALAQRLYEYFVERDGSDFDQQTLQAFEQVLFHDRSVADVAVALGMSENAVRLAKFRVLQRLRQIAPEFFDDYPT